MAKDYKDVDWDNWSYDEENNDSSIEQEEEIIVRDANGNILKDGDTVIAIKDLAVKGAPDIKRGDKFTKIKLTDDVELIESGKIVLRTEFFKKI
ncbi:PhnA domain-containing protein [Candidatus Gracilibacteria bacterium]|nr:PhnA domain-containing protein [Candidatus Gracilibacteria bacterium]